MEELNVVNDTVEEVVTPQEVEATEVVESVESEVATDTPTEVEKPKQTKEQNALAAETRRRIEQEAKDKVIEEMYFESHGIKTKAEYDKLMAKQKERALFEKIKNSDSDPETVKRELYKEWEKTDPRLQEYEKIQAENYTTKQLSELNKDLKEMGLDAIESVDDIASLPSADKVIEYVRSGKTLNEAYFLANKKEIIQAQADKIQQDTIKKIQANSNANPGSLADTGKGTAFYSREQVDAMSQSDVNKHYDIIMKSMKSWK